jgi:glycosyltransferase involved in cell wall biosynthesis
MADAVVRVTADPELARRLTGNARVRVTENYRSDRVIPRLVKVYHDVTAGRRA